MSVALSGIGSIPLLLVFSLSSTSADSKSPEQITLHKYDVVTHQTEDIARLIRLGDEFKSKQTPAEIAKTFVEIEEMKSKIATQISMKFPNYIIQTLKLLQRKLAALKNDVKKKLLVSLDGGIDNWLEDLKQFKAWSVDEAVQRKAGTLEKSLREIKFDLEKLDSIYDLYRIKSEVENIMVGLGELQKTE